MAIKGNLVTYKSIMPLVKPCLAVHTDNYRQGLQDISASLCKMGQLNYGVNSEIVSGVNLDCDSNNVHYGDTSQYAHQIEDYAHNLLAFGTKHPNDLLFRQSLALFLVLIQLRGHHSLRMSKFDVESLVKNQMNGDLLGLHNNNIFTVSKYVNYLQSQELVPFSKILNKAKTINAHSQYIIDNDITPLIKHYVALVQRYLANLIDDTRAKFQKSSPIYTTLIQHIKASFSANSAEKYGKQYQEAHERYHDALWMSHRFYTIAHILRTHVLDNNYYLSIYDIVYGLQNLQKRDKDNQYLHKLAYLLQCLLKMPKINTKVLRNVPCFKSDLTLPNMMSSVMHSGYLTNPKLIYDYEHYVK